MADPTDPRSPGTPLWVKVFGIIFVVVVFLFLILMFARGAHHGPGRHMSMGASGAPSGSSDR